MFSFRSDFWSFLRFLTAVALQNSRWPLNHPFQVQFWSNNHLINKCIHKRKKITGSRSWNVKKVFIVPTLVLAKYASEMALKPWSVVGGIWGATLRMAQWLKKFWLPVIFLRFGVKNEVWMLVFENFIRKGWFFGHYECDGMSTVKLLENITISSLVTI